MSASRDKSEPNKKIRVPPFWLVFQKWGCGNLRIVRNRKELSLETLKPCFYPSSLGRIFPVRRYRLCHPSDSVSKCGVCLPYESDSARAR